jgi:CDP-4-dehydro-6-deoxyglucose reductase
VPTVSVEPDGIRVEARPGEGILAALNRSGYGYRVGCRRGGCGICKVDVLSGGVDYTVTVAESVLPARDRAQGCALSCRAVPVQDVVIRLRDDRLRCTSPLLAAVFRAQRTEKPETEGQL